MLQNNAVNLQSERIKQMYLMKRVLYAASVLLTTLGALSCSGDDTRKNEVAKVEVVEAVGVGDGALATFTGRTKSSSEVNLAFRVSGPISRVLVQEGDHVAKGQVVAVMDSRDYQVQLAATQAEYEQVKADAERVMALYTEGNTTASNNDKARYGLQQITQKLISHRNQLADTRLRSTIDGYVQTKLHEAGEVVSAGMPVVSVFGSGDTEVEIHLSASDFAHLNQFTNFFCKFDVTGDDSYPLTIARTSQEANSAQLYTVRLRFVGTVDSKSITPGMTTMVYANVAKCDTDRMVKVPTSAVFKKEEKTQVFVYKATSAIVEARSVRVVAVNRDGTMQVEGVKVAEKVVVSGVHHLKDGQRVQLLQKPSSTNAGGLL